MDRASLLIDAVPDGFDETACFSAERLSFSHGNVAAPGPLTPLVASPTLGRRGVGTVIGDDPK